MVSCVCRCLGALAEWERLSEACRYEWRHMEPHLRPQMAYLGANAAWHMGQWDEMATYVGALESEEGPELSTGSFMSAVLNVRQGNYGAAKGEPPASLTTSVLIIEEDRTPVRFRGSGVASLHIGHDC